MARMSRHVDDERVGIGIENEPMSASAAELKQARERGGGESAHRRRERTTRTSIQKDLTFKFDIILGIICHKNKYSNRHITELTPI